jgi:transcriptional regulator with XRE-family HTH domain
MITAIRDVRRAKGLTLEDVARRCTPPTTAQTIGRLETGTRTVSVGWLNRIAAALAVTTGDLVRLPDQSELPVAARLDETGAHAPSRPATLAAPQVAPGMLAVTVARAVGDYRTGDAIWCERVAAGDFARARNRDVLVPRPGGRYVFGRLIGQEDGTPARLLILPPGPGARQQVVQDAPWLAIAVRLVRTL